MKYREKKILNYKPEQLFDLVSDIKKYPEFLPWCLGSRVKKISHKQLNADLIVGMRIYREIFISPFVYVVSRNTIFNSPNIL